MKKLYPKDDSWGSGKRTTRHNQLTRETLFEIMTSTMQKIFNSRFTLVLTVLIVLGITFGTGFSAGLKAHPDIEKVTNLDNKENGKPSTVDFSPFWKVWNTLEEKYVSPNSTTTVSSQDKVWGAIEGLAGSFNDPYTVFFAPENNKMFTSEISGNFEGIGMQVGTKDDTITVIAPLKDTPAEKAGILPGDKILKIDDTITAGMKEDEAVRRIRGKAGTEVSLTIIREGKHDPVEIKVVRGTINIPTIDTEIRLSASGKPDISSSGLQANGVYIVRLYSFSQPSPDLFREALRKFYESGSNKLVLDLRGNPGGYLEAAVDMASWFLPPGKVVVSEDFGKNKPSVTYRSHREVVFGNDLKFVILVNGGSASASEILAGALQEYGVAKLVGATTFGKGVVQELVEITPETSLKVTVAQWLTPKGNSISQKGITPDLEVKITPEDIANGKDPQMEAAFKLLLK